ncbi:hypothetical protein [Bradyrhizobium vignae]|uniref:hypothetical protein n=1 Tax=Bradyrhizobium vignae TaxID=1549949 RepID=UPI0011AE8DFA|nr:hypothetical protein [Bradyrhizobium vignae]
MLDSAAGTLTPFEGLRIVSVRLRSVNLHDFDDPQDNGEYDLKGLCEAVASCISSMSSHPKKRRQISSIIDQFAIWAFAVNVFPQITAGSSPSVGG